MAYDTAKNNKLILYLVRGDEITAENFANFVNRLTGRNVSEEGMARLRAILAKTSQ
jgi:hypothetical protein